MLGWNGLESWVGSVDVLGKFIQVALEKFGFLFPHSLKGVGGAMEGGCSIEGECGGGFCKG